MAPNAEWPGAGTCGLVLNQQLQNLLLKRRHQPVCVGRAVLQSACKPENRNIVSRNPRYRNALKASRRGIPQEFMQQIGGVQVVPALDGIRWALDGHGRLSRPKPLWVGDIHHDFVKFCIYAAKKGRQ